ncbi:MAG: hypothetical protein A2161_17730 [Candidatus Schekmanbacteria bacterium RBG_13_48_7]|uniref:RND efflux pump membrane fusion protein barrel-sandwich domain-containing protein n=1 Tax=Candidatus Schekmanbacteria bacterium RBG_13_48_7 TaxID=1817878 RepID=A0A1F7RQQ2_9BACT|nr:MAG: hypothetical protein A2161_17730 [Candidatus Schekmanbacteria bacterium RBG_13_48_7]
MKKKIIISGMIIAVSVFAGCMDDSSKQSSGGKSSGKVPVVKVIQATEETILRTLELTGSVTATKVAKMGSPAEGPVTVCLVREGDNVRAGQKLLTIGRKKAADALVETANDALKREQEEFNRVKKLVASGAIPGEELDTASLRVSRAKAELSRAQENVEDYEIVAPWKGVVSKVFITDGYYVSPREHLVEIYDPKSLVIEFAVPEVQAAVIYESMPVNIQLDAYPQHKLKGKITRVYPELDRQTRTRIAEAMILGNNNIVLLPGLFARVTVVLEKIEQAILVPASAIVMTLAEAESIFIVNDQKVQSRKIKTGVEQDLKIQILEGIQAGEWIVVEGNEKLKNGMAVEVLDNDAKKKTGESTEVK